MESRLYCVLLAFLFQTKDVLKWSDVTQRVNVHTSILQTGEPGFSYSPITHFNFKMSSVKGLEPMPVLQQ